MNGRKESRKHTREQKLLHTQAIVEKTTTKNHAKHFDFQIQNGARKTKPTSCMLNRPEENDREKKTPFSVKS